MSQRFTEYLIEAAKEEGEIKLFNPTRFVPKIKQALDLMIKAAGDADEKMDEIIILEMISVFKEVLVNRLRPYAKKDYKERKDDKDGVATIKEIEKEIKEALIEQFNERYYKTGIAKFMALVVSPIMSEIERVSPPKALAAIDTSSYKENAKDAFGVLMKKVITSDIFSNPDDAKVAKKTLQKMSQTANKESKKTRRLSKGQRLKMIRKAAEKVQGE
jgi:hypothetical protein